MTKKQILRSDVRIRVSPEGEISIHGVPKDIFELLAKQADDLGISNDNTIPGTGVEWVEFGKVTFYKG